MHIFSKLTLLTVVASLAVASFGPGAVAQSATANQSEISVDVGDGCTETIDNHTAVCGSSYDDGVLTVELQSDRPQRITLVDAGVFMDGGGQMSRSRHFIDDGRSTVSVSATKVDGLVGVSINNGRTLYGYVHKPPSTGFLPGSPSPNDALVAGATVFSLFGVCLPGAYFGLKRYKGGEHDEL